MDAEEIQAAVAEGMKVEDYKSIDSNPTAGVFTLRDRYRRTMQYQKGHKLPNFEFGYWEETLGEWHKQGLPKHIDNEAKAYEFFGIENWQSAWINTGMTPGFEPVSIEETDEYITTRDSNGCTSQINKTGHKSIPHYIDFLLKDREIWEKDFKHRFDPETPGRIPENWSELVPVLNNRDYPLAVSVGSMIGVPRNLIGFENIAMMVYDDPDLLEEIVEAECNLVCGVLEKILPDVDFDFGCGWEDICFNSGPVVGEKFMREVVGPRYKRIADLLHKHGTHVIWTDCDGNLSMISDVFVDNGYNCFFPVEVNGGTDPVALREKHGTKALFQGAFCKMKFLEGGKGVENELHRLLPVVTEGGFIPGVDHRVQADAPLDVYMYYMKRKRELFNTGGKPLYDESKVGLKNDGTVEIPKLK